MVDFYCNRDDKKVEDCPVQAEAMKNHRDSTYYKGIREMYDKGLVPLRLIEMERDPPRINLTYNFDKKCKDCILGPDEKTGRPRYIRDPWVSIDAAIYKKCSNRNTINELQDGYKKMTKDAKAAQKNAKKAIKLAQKLK